MTNAVNGHSEADVGTEFQVLLEHNDRHPMKRNVHTTRSLSRNYCIPSLVTINTIPGPLEHIVHHQLTGSEVVDWVAK